MSTVDASAPLTSTDILRRQGNQLVNSLGNPVVLRGTTGDMVNSGQGGWMTTSGFTFEVSAATEQLDMMQNWGFNGLRITMSVELWLKSIDDNRANLRYVVSQAQQRGIYVTVAPWSVLYSGNPSGEWQSNALPYPPYQGDQSHQALAATEAVIPNKQAFIDFYGQLVNDLKAYPNVLFEVWNEPHADIYAGEAARADFFANVVNPIIANARNSGAQQPFVIDGNWGGINTGDFLPYVEGIPDNNFALSFHLYTHFGHLDAWGNPTDYNGLMDAFSASGVVAASKVYPIYFGELGITVGSQSERTQYDNILHIFADNDWSWGVWWFRDTNIFAFVDATGSPTTEGLIYQKWLQITTPQPTPTSTPPATPTPTPTLTPTSTPNSLVSPTPTTMATATSQPTLSSSPTATPTFNPTPHSTAKPTPTPWPTATPSITSTPTPSPTTTSTANPDSPQSSNGIFIAGLTVPSIVGVAVGLTFVLRKRKGSSPVIK
ncbi:MAG: glycoside hydrolase family 5 protein [Candidatus Bathyarchaeia archaeon]